MSFEKGTESQYVWEKLVREMEKGPFLRHVPINPHDKNAIDNAKEQMRLLSKRVYMLVPEMLQEFTEYCHNCGGIDNLIIIKSIYYNDKHVRHIYVCKNCRGL